MTFVKRTKLILNILKRDAGFMCVGNVVSNIKVKGQCGYEMIVWV